MLAYLMFPCMHAHPCAMSEQLVERKGDFLLEVGWKIPKGIRKISLSNLPINKLKIYIVTASLS